MMPVLQLHPAVNSRILCPARFWKHRPLLLRFRRSTYRSTAPGGDTPNQSDNEPAAEPHKQRQQQQQQEQSYPPGYDPNAAAGFMPQPGDRPFWWVEQFEKRRLELAKQQAAAAAGGVTGSADASTSTPETISSSDSDSAAVEAPAPPVTMTPQMLTKAVLQSLQLLVVVALLILWPASLYPGGLASPRIWLIFWCYWLFFAGGSVYRLLRHGPLAARKKDVQHRSWGSTAAWLMFVASIPVIHFPPVREFFTTRQQQQQLLLLKQVAAVSAGSSSSSSASISYAVGSAGAGGVGGVMTLYDLLGGLLLTSAIALNWWAARTLGRAYDRVVKPEKLVTDGPYAFIQHPIYTSYMLLFAGYAMALHSGTTALFSVAVCLVYYRSRTRLEQGVLQEAFGEQYDAYRRSTKMFVPFVW